MSKSVHFFLLIIVSSFFSNRLRAQPVPEEKISYAGKDFWMTIYETALINEFYITGEHDATITFTYTTNNTSENYAFQAGTILKVPLTAAQTALIRSSVIEAVQNNSIHITSDADIVVQYVSWGILSDDGTLLFPSDRQQYGNLYYLNGIPYMPGSNVFSNTTAGFSMVATCDSVSLEITPSRNTASHLSGIPFDVQLHKGQTYTIASAGSNNIKDLSGTKVEIKKASCCNPLNIFNSNTAGFTYWPYDNPLGLCCADMAFEQLLPVSTWDTFHLVVPSLNNPYNILKIVSAADNNNILFDGVPVATLANGATLDTIIKEPVIIQSTGKVGITQYMLSLGVLFPPGQDIPSNVSPDSMTDPNAAWVLPPRDGLKEAYFNTVGQSYISNNVVYGYYGLHVLTIISKADNINTITLNNVPVGGQFVPFPGNPAFMYAEIRPDTGILYHLQSEQKVIAYYYAATVAGSINFLLGDVRPSVFYDELNPDTITACISDTILLSAGTGVDYIWSTGDTIPQISVTDTGAYYVIKHNDDDCIGEMKRFIIERPSTYLPILDLGADTIICRGQRMVLNGAGPQTEWSTGITGSEILVDEPGIYWATARDTCIGLIVSDTINIKDTVCLSLYCNFAFPNAFSPNNDGHNDIFLPVYFGQISNYSLSIYNRWGERVFSSFKIDDGWNGSYKSAPADIGVYYYLCRFYCPVRGYITTKGEVTLIR